MMVTAAARLRHFPLSSYYHHILGIRHLSTPQSPLPLVSLSHSSSSSSSSPLLRRHTEPFLPNLLLQKFHFSCGASGNGSSDGVRRGSGGGGGWNAGENSDDPSSSSSSSSSLSSWVGPIGAFLNGWRSRVAADPQFPFKVVMEQLVGVSACVLGDMASRPNFGLNELDFVFSTLVVGCILNFVLMYLLAPTSMSSSSTTRTLPSVFANCPTSHMFEPGPYGLLNRFGTFLYKGVLFAAVGFAAGLVGTAISNGLIQMRKKMDPNFETPNKPPPTILNAGTWAIHMGVSSNLRYQTLNGVEFLLANLLPPLVFKTSVVVVRCFNNVLGGMSFVILARLTGSQSLNVHEGKQQQQLVTEAPAAEMEKELLNRSDDSSRSNQSS